MQYNSYYADIQDIITCQCSVLLSKFYYQDMDPNYVLTFKFLTKYSINLHTSHMACPAYPPDGGLIIQYSASPPNSWFEIVEINIRFNFQNRRLS